MKYSGWPEPGNLVVGRVDEIEDFGVFIDLLEYENKRGLCHISEVASGWIKNVRDHVNTDQRVVAKVLDVDESAQQIDLSLKDVNDHQRKDKIQEWKSEQKADNWMEIDAIVETARDNVSVPFVQVTGYVDLECSAGDGVDAVREALQAAEGNGEIPEEIDLEVTYVGAPEYRIEVKAPDYKTAERELEASATRATDEITGRGGTGEFHRERRESEE